MVCAVLNIATRPQAKLIHPHPAAPRFRQTTLAGQPEQAVHTV